MSQFVPRSPFDDRLAEAEGQAGCEEYHETRVISYSLSSSDRTSN